MPCNGVAVASGRIAQDLARLIKEMPAENLKRAVIEYLQTQFPEQVGRQQPRPMPRRYYPQFGSVSFALGRYLVEITQGGSVVVSVERSKFVINDQRTTQAMQKGITDLLTGLAGMARQNQVLNALKSAGYPVNSFSRAQNGAVVLSVEV